MARAALAAAIMTVAACAAPGSAGDGNRVAAQAAYDSCLAKAARYADTGKQSAAELAQIVAPLCYPQYLALEKDIADGLSYRARRQYELDADGQQLAFATAAIKQERTKQQLAGVVSSQP